MATGLNDEGWEARMSKRAKARGAEQIDDWRERLLREHRAKEREYLQELRTTMTLEAATFRVRHAGRVGCACVGGWSCCLNAYKVALEVHRAAHIAVKLIAEAGI